jgi:hypothetical protein
MSGGHFGSDKGSVSAVREEIECLVHNNEKVDSWGYSRNYGPRTLDKFREAIALLQRAEVMVQRIDYLVSDDDGEDDFHVRWAQELQALERGVQ